MPRSVKPGVKKSTESPKSGFGEGQQDQLLQVKKKKLAGQKGSGNRCFCRSRLRSMSGNSIDWGGVVNERLGIQNLILELSNRVLLPGATCNSIRGT